jgi:hypothetical protein
MCGSILFICFDHEQGIYYTQVRLEWDYVERNLDFYTLIIVPHCLQHVLGVAFMVFLLVYYKLAVQQAFSPILPNGHKLICYSSDSTK